MKATCPKDPSHQTFITVAHVTEDWLVDEEGNFLDMANDDHEVVHGPDACNTWACAVCGEEAVVVED